LELERRDVPSRPLPYPVIYVGAETGAPPVVKAYDAETGKLNFERTAYEPTFTGGVRVATADFTGDGFPDLAVAPGEGGGPRVRILDGKTGLQIDGPLGNFFAFSPDFKGGVEVAAGDVTGDNVPDLIVAAGKSGGPHVRVFDGQTGQAIMNFMAFDPDFRGGVSIAAADFTLDGKSDLVVGAGIGGGPHIKTFDVATGQTIPGPLGNFFAFEPEFRGGVRVGTDWKTGDFGGDGRANLAVGPGPGRSPDVKLYSGATGQLLRQFQAFEPTMTAGVRVALAYVNDDAMADVVVATGAGVPNQVRVFDTKTNQLMTDHPGIYTPFGPTNTNGLTLAATNDPPNQYGFFDLPVYETFEHIPQEAELNYNKYRVHEHVFVEDDRLRWELTVTNTSMDFVEWTQDLTDIGLGVFQIPTYTTSDVFIVDNKNGWSGGVTSTNGEEGYIRFEGTPIFVNESVLLTFTTPLLSPVLDWSTAAAKLLPPPEFPWPLQSTTILQVAVPGPKIEALLTSRGENAPQFIPTDHLKVAKWENAFTPTFHSNGLYKGYYITPPENNNNFDFIDTDIDRFYVWVRDLASWTNNVLRVSVGVSTSNLTEYSAYNDNVTNIDLVRFNYAPSGENNAQGWYRSDSQMLVSNEADDKFKSASYLREDEQNPAGLGLLKDGKQWLISDRTHKIALGGNTKAEYTIPGTTAKVKVEANTPVRSYVNVHANIIKVNGLEVISKADAESYLFRSNEQYAQVGIQFHIEVANPITIPTTATPPVNFNDGFDEGNLNRTDEEKALVPFRSQSTDDIDVFFVDRFNWVPETRGLAYTAILVPDEFDDMLVISKDKMSMFTFAHEAGHILMNHTGDQTINHYCGSAYEGSLMYAYTTSTDSELATKRLISFHENMIFGPLPARPNLVQPNY
jgi:hypothetical protein